MDREVFASKEYYILQWRACQSLLPFDMANADIITRLDQLLPRYDGFRENPVYALLFLSIRRE